jgi:hypothetical protein
VKQREALVHAIMEHGKSKEVAEAAADRVLLKYDFFKELPTVILAA